MPKPFIPGLLKSALDMEVFEFLPRGRWFKCMEIIMPRLQLNGWRLKDRFVRLEQAKLLECRRSADNWEYRVNEQIQAALAAVPDHVSDEPRDRQSGNALAVNSLIRISSRLEEISERYAQKADKGSKSAAYAVTSSALGEVSAAIQAEIELLKGGDTPSNEATIFDEAKRMVGHTQNHK